MKSRSYTRPRARPIRIAGVFLSSPASRVCRDIACPRYDRCSLSKSDLCQRNIGAQHLEDDPIFVAAQVSSGRFADREGLGAKAALEVRIPLCRIPEATVELRAGLRGHTMSEATFCPTGWHCRIKLLQMLETFVLFDYRAIILDP